LYGEKVSGVLALEQDAKGGATSITGTIKLLPTGKHGFHIHQYGDLSDGCKSSGAHFNPFNKQHGGPSDADRHVGDLGNLEAKDGTDTKINITDHLISLVGPNSVIGRAFVVHADEDDLGKGGHDDSLQTGHAGARLACGVIGITK